MIDYRCIDELIQSIEQFTLRASTIFAKTIDLSTPRRDNWHAVKKLYLGI